MKCFYHHERDAVGSCKTCGKGVCAECAVDLDKGLACRDRCEDDAKALIALIERNIQMSAKTSTLLRTSRQTFVWSAVFSVIIGAVFLAWGLVVEPWFSFGLVMGGIFLAYGLFSLARLFWMPRVDVAQGERPSKEQSANEQ